MRPYSILLLGLIALAGCADEPFSQPKMEPVANLTNVSAQNVSSVIRLINDLCVRRSASTLEMAKGIAATGWQWQQTQSADPKQPLSLDLWKHPPVQLLRGNLAGEQITNCTVSIEGPSAPAPNSIASELSKLTGTRNQRAREWWWRSNRSTQTRIELIDSAFDQKSGITVLVENYKLPWWRTILGN
jgi:hypothetical protein